MQIIEMVHDVNEMVRKSGNVGIAGTRGELIQSFGSLPFPAGSLILVEFSYNQRLIV